MHELNHYPEEFRYTEEGYWVQVVDKGRQAIVGVTVDVVANLGEVITVGEPLIDTEVDQAEEIGFIEGEYVTMPIIAPITGTIVKFNEDLEDSEGLINNDPYGDGWLFKMSIDCPEELDSLMNASEYREFVKVSE